MPGVDQVQKTEAKPGENVEARNLLKTGPCKNRTEEEKKKKEERGFSAAKRLDDAEGVFLRRARESAATNTKKLGMRREAQEKLRRCLLEGN